MEIDLVVVDGPNVYNTVGSFLSEAGDSRTLTGYMRDWLDFDRLVRATLKLSSSPTLGTVIFHSARALGRRNYRIANAHVDQFWGRQGANPETSCLTVTIPGQQNSTGTGPCPKCECEVEVELTAEKGIDTALTTYLFQTSDAWHSVCLFTRDADFVPPITALRHQGKRAYVAAEPSAALTGLARVAQSFFPLDVEYLRQDFALYKLVTPGGLLDRILQCLQEIPGLKCELWHGPTTQGARIFLAGGLTLSLSSDNPAANPSAVDHGARLVDSILGEAYEIGRPTLWEPRGNGAKELRLVTNAQLLEGLDRHIELCASSEWTKVRKGLADARVGAAPQEQ